MFHVLFAAIDKIKRRLTHDDAQDVQIPRAVLERALVRPHVYFSRYLLYMQLRFLFFHSGGFIRPKYCAAPNFFCEVLNIQFLKIVCLLYFINF